ncbi:MAG: DUF4199 domain-containing protein [Eudoraea sp.]|nr:DUF4199 domain-containing protein [Eudoraea sp.]
MEETQPKIGKFSLNYGLILGVVGVIFGIMLFTMDAHTSRDSSNTIISLVMTVAVITWGIWAFRKANGGFLKLGQAVKLGAGIALIAGVISVIYVLFLANVLDPEFIVKTAEAAKAAAIEDGRMSSEQIQQQYDGTLNMFWVFTIPVILIFNIIIGLVIGLIDGLILKKAKPDY